LDTRKVQYVEVAAHINDPDFAEKAVDLLVSMLKK
jgi:uncharacterized protein (UPF0261 family)